jgi:spore coat protein SA
MSSVTIVTPGSFPVDSNKTSSVEASVIHMAPYLAEKWPVTILGKRYPDMLRQSTKDGVKYVNLHALTKKGYVRSTIRYLQKQPSSIVQIENRPRFVPWFRKYFPLTTLILVLHSISFIQPKSIRRERLLRAFSEVDQIIVNSQFLKEYIIRIDPSIDHKVVVNHLGVDQERFSPISNQGFEENQQMLNSLGLNGKKVILFVGRLIYIKGVHRLIQALDEVKQHYTEFMLLIVGSPFYGKNKSTPYSRKLQELAKANADHIRFVPFVPMQEIHRWYRLSDVVVVPSIGLEAFGLVNVEAMASGVPIVASQVGGIPEVVTDRETGLLVPLDKHAEGIANALIELLTNTELSHSLGLNGRKRVEALFTWQHAAERLNEVYENSLVN